MQRYRPMVEEDVEPGPDRRWRAAQPYAAVCIVWLIALSRWISTATTIPWDSKNQFYAFFRFLANALHQGASPFWNPYHYAGHPSIADPQSLIFAPQFLIWAWLDPDPTLRAFDIVVLAHLLVGALAIVALGRRRGWTPAACVLAASIFMLGASASARLNHTGIITSYGLFPLALLVMEDALDRRSWLSTFAFTLIAANILLARNQVALMLVLVLILFIARSILVAQRPWRYMRARIPHALLVATLGGAIIAVPTLLSLQFAALSNRPATSLATALEASLHPANLALLFAANVFGTHIPDYGYWGPNNAVLPEVAATDDSFNYIFVGAVPVALILAFGIGAGRLLWHGQRTITVFLAAALLFAFGRYTPVYPFVFDHVPGFAFFRRPIDAVFIVGIAVALLSGALLSLYVRDGPPPTSRLGRTLALAAAVAVAAEALWVSSLTGHALRAAASLAAAAALAGGLLWTMLRAVTTAHRQRAAVLVTLIAVGELLYWNAASQLNAEGIDYYEVLHTPSGEDARVLQVLETELARRHAAGDRPRVEIVGLGGPWQNLAMTRGIEAANGYNPLRIGHYDRLVAPGEVAYDVDGRSFPASFPAYDGPLARELGLAYLVLDRPVEKLRPLLHPERAELLMAGPNAWIYRLPDTAPRVVFRSDLAARAEQAAGARDLTPVAAGEAGHARLTAWRPDRIEIAVTAPQAGEVLLHDIDYPGWIAEVDGRPVPIRRARGLFRAVTISAGAHTVVFRFAPLSWANLAAALRQRVEGP